ncbi:MAG: hypothetical protein JWO06_2991 [Bacteroidota bacterium]|nr:hypothetical protein [Bacteroidota bacterium]
MKVQPQTVKSLATRFRKAKSARTAKHHFAALCVNLRAPLRELHFRTHSEFRILKSKTARVRSFRPLLRTRKLRQVSCAPCL